MKANHLILFSLLFVGLYSCKKKEENTTPVATKANISGNVNLYNEGVTILDPSGMTVSIEGSNPLITALTDIDGRYTLSQVPFGTYTLVYEKAGFGTYKKFNVQHNSSTGTFISQTPSLGQNATTTVTSLSASSSVDFPVILSVETNPAASLSSTKYLRFFFSSNANVSNENYEHYLEPIAVQNSPHNLNLSQNAIDVLGFTSGQTIYAKCYGDAFYSNSYSDPVLIRDIFPNLNLTSAAAVSFVIP